MASKEKKSGFLEEEELGGAKPQYKASYDAAADDAYEKLSGRPAFSYDPRSDPMYKNYRDSYINQGRMAMKDSMGQAGALTGGYASSYAQSIGQQQYDAHLQKLGDVIPELYRLAYSKYSDEGDQLFRQYNALTQLKDEEYDRYQDELDDYYRRQELEYQREKDSKAFEEKQREQSYSRVHDEAAMLAKYGDFSGYAAIYGQETADRMREHYIAANPDIAFNLGLIDAGRYFALTGKYSPGQAAAPAQSSGRSGTYYPSTAPDGRDAATVQRELRNQGYNIAVDGAWGPKSQAAWEKAYGSGKMTGLENNENYLFKV